MIRMSELRKSFILPSAKIDELAGRKISFVRIEKEADGLPWHKAEKHVLLGFSPEQSALDDRPRLSKVCASCGICCKNIPQHQIGIYMSEKELRHAESAGHEVKISHTFQSEGVDFHLLAVKENGDCAMLGENGCTLGEEKPVWCKGYYCEQLYGGKNPYEQDKLLNT